MPFRFQPLEIPDLILVEAEAFGDHRGFFMETYKSSEFARGGIPEEFVQDNYSHSPRAVFRGLHYQIPPQAQGKLVTALRGEVLDVAVDIRRGSPWFGRGKSVILSASNHRMIYVPSGFAHGFCVLSKEADVVYKVTAEYAPDLDRGILWNDPEIGLSLPFDRLLLSDKDRSLPLLRDADNPFTFDGADP